ncbi:RNA 2'-phosphotransferase [Paenibacillus dauci]|uniref:RNA 2'-phosphotransferase n=1 Tax=Paenibacillus dauci TaxID=1567106 RepID=UPI0006198C9E|nr:RNA 2'-phosphotransferase [Paenibacillus dauci]
MLELQQEKQLSKWISLILRHSPEQYGIVLDEDAACPINELVQVICQERKWSFVTDEHIRYVVARSDKQRFEIMGDRIRARYGHSRPAIHYEASVPPDVLYHGTSVQAWTIIEKEGLRPMGRRYVHLSEKTDFAELAGKRKGKLVLLKINTAAAVDHIMFYNAGHGVWLCDHIPAECISIL